MGLVLKIISGALHLASDLVLVIVRAMAGALGSLRRVLVIGIDAGRAAHALRGGKLHCPQGHVIEIEGVYECTSCGFVYRGSVWLCANPECQAPVAPFVACFDCGLCVRNPFRYGRPE